jgi:hypothetical protein
MCEWSPQPPTVIDGEVLAHSATTRVTAERESAHSEGRRSGVARGLTQASCRTSVSDFLSQKRISISRYIALALASCS